MTTLAEFNKAVAKSVIAYAELKQKESVYNQALIDVQSATAANEDALNQVKLLASTLDADAIDQLKLL